MGRSPSLLKAGAVLGAGVVIAILALGEAAPASPGCDRVAALNGSDRNPGTESSPFRTPGRLVRDLPSGGTGCLRSGTYTETSVKIARDGVTIQSYPGEQARWQGRVVINGDRVVLQRLALDGSRGSTCAGGVLPSPTISGSGVVIRENDIQSPDAGICVHPRRDGRAVPRRFVIERNRIHDCGRRPATNHDHGVYVAEAAGGVIRDNVIYGNADRGVQLYPNARGIVVERNTVDGNGQGIVFGERSAGNVVRGNIFSNAVIRWNAERYAVTGRGNAFTGNCVHASHPNSYYRQGGGVRVGSRVRQSGTVIASPDPRYVNRAAHDFRLQDGSPCAGRGAPPEVTAPKG
jgi:parallel beta-helix repeat protein